jgi:hypothetical protein
MDAEYCRQRAMECVIAGRRSDISPERRRSLVWMACQWVQLAEIAQRLDEVAELKRGALPAQTLWRDDPPSTLI